MKKKLFYLIVCCLFLLLGDPIVYGKSVINLPVGFLIGDTNGISVTKNGNYFFDLEGLLPGDTISRQLIIQNKNETPYDLELLIEPISSTGPIDLFEELGMKLTLENKTIYNGNIIDNQTGKAKTLHRVDLGTVAPHSEKTLDILLNMKQDIPYEEYLKGESQANVRWNFHATHSVDESNSSSIFPQTGEKLSNRWWIMLGILCIFIVIIIFRQKEKNKR